MNRKRSCSFALVALSLLGVMSPIAAQTVAGVRAPDSGLNAANVAGLYQMIDPRGYADPLAAAVYLRLMPDGRSRLEAVVVNDANGTITSKTEIGDFQRTPWRMTQGAGGPELCVDVAGKSHCSQVERDLATNDLLLYDVARPRGHADLRLHKITPPQRTAVTQ